MKHLTLIIFLTLSIFSFGQKEGQIFCDGNPKEGYFPLLESKKYLVWGNTYYIEEFVGKKTLNDKMYYEYKQSWETGDVVYLYLREEKGVIYQYEECCDDDTIRLPKKPKKDKTWRTADKLSVYEIKSLKGELKTPICTYKDLLVLKSTLKNGSFTFYYQKGYGFIGATQNGGLISFASPISPDKLRKH